MLARESAATMTPSLNIKARVVVPFAGFTIWIASFWKSSKWTGLGSSNDGGAEISPTMSLLGPNCVVENDSRPLVSSFMITTNLAEKKEWILFPKYLWKNIGIMWEKLKRCYVWNHQSLWTCHTDFSRITSWMWDLPLSSMFDVLRKQKWTSYFACVGLREKEKGSNGVFPSDCLLNGHWKIMGRSPAWLELPGASNPKLRLGALSPNGVHLHLGCLKYKPI